MIILRLRLQIVRGLTKGLQNLCIHVWTLHLPKLVHIILSPCCWALPMTFNGWIDVGAKKVLKSKEKEW
jgi:hypothetical protein